MDARDIVNRLKALLLLDTGTHSIYKQAMQRIVEDDIREQLNEFCEDHGQHVTDLEEFISEVEGSVIMMSAGQVSTFVGCANDRVSEVQTIEGTDRILETLRKNELVTNKYYEEAIEWELKPEMMNILEQNLEDEQAHLQYIEGLLTIRRKAA